MTELEKARQTIDCVDKEMVHLFEERMAAVRQIAAYKLANGLPVEDADREAEILSKNIDLVKNQDNREYYAEVQKTTLKQSKRLQWLLHNKMYVSTSCGGYEVTTRRGGLHCLGNIFDLDRKVLVVSDSGVPEEYIMTAASQCGEAIVFVFEQGESSKCVGTYTEILRILSDNHFTRTDCIIAVGGGVVGDIAGFAAASYMRGVDFYNIPTTLLSQVDASIGGKTAINFDGYKNLVGAFYPPRGVLIDLDLLHTLSPRQMANGVAEIIKVALTHDAELLAMLECEDGVTEEMVCRALCVKKQVVEADEHEKGLRKVLNFGHTLGHAIESVGKYYHGECVALGMLPMCAPDVRERLLPVLTKWGLPTIYTGNADDVIRACHYDKKADGSDITVIYVPSVGAYEMKTVSFDDYERRIREVLG